MKQITIKKVELSNAGPISSFSQEFAPLTLVYGPNESGKTTLLSNMVNTLFSAGGTRKKTLLEQSGGFSGFTRILLNTPEGERVLEPGDRGLSALLPHSFSAFPPDLHRLLYVRAGDPQLEAAGAGVSRTLVKGLVSNQQVYDRIGQDLPNETGYTSIEGGVLLGNKQGMMKRLLVARERLTAVRRVSDSFHGSLSRAKIARLRREEAQLVEAQEAQLRARRHRAYLVSQELTSIEEERDALDKRRLEKLSKTLYEYEGLKKSLAESGKRSKASAGAEAKQKWLASARNRYLELSGGAPVSAARWHLPTAMGLIAAAAAFLLVSPVPGAVCAAAALVVVGLKFFRERSALKRGGQGNARALEEIRQDFAKKFGSKVASLADFDTQLEALRDEVATHRAAEREQADAERGLESCQLQLDEGLGVPAAKSGRKPDYAALLKKLTARWEKLDAVWHKRNTELAVLAVDEADYLQADPGGAFSRAALEKIDKQLEHKAAAIREQEEGYNTLRSEIAGLLGHALPEDPGAISEAIEGARAAAEEDVLDLSARLYAGILVKEALHSFVKKEDEQVALWLADAGIGQYVKALTGRYDRVSFEEEELMVGNSQERFPLSSLSSGAVEQVLLALRMGIAPAITGQQALFLLLDDAFQFSDWDRRELMVDSVAKMVERGWQVVYFSMDDDIRQRIGALGKKLGKGRYAEIDLAAV